MSKEKPTVFGKGYTTKGKYKQAENGKRTPAGSAWHQMLKRLFDKNYTRKENYKDITIYEPWLDFQVFAEWHEKNYIDGWEMDKDLLSDPNNKKYSPETCCFIPQELNKFLANRKSNNTTGHTGVTYVKTSKKYKAYISVNNKRVHLGSFKTITEASEKYESVRKILSRRWRKKLRKLNVPRKVTDKIK